MEAILYTLIYLVIINFYLILTKRRAMPTMEKFMVSLMSIFILFSIFQITGYIMASRADKIMSPAFNLTFMFIMIFIMPVLSTELVLFLYKRFIIKKKN